MKRWMIKKALTLILSFAMAVSISTTLVSATDNIQSVSVQLTQDMVTLSEESAVYDGAQHKPAVIVRGASGEELAEGTDYTVAYSASDFTNAGTIKITVTGKENYTGTIEKTYKIEKAQPVIAWDVAGDEEKTLIYTGYPAVIRPIVTLANNEIFDGTIHYHYGTYSGFNPPTDAGSYTVKVSIEEQNNYKAAMSGYLLLYIEPSQPTIAFKDGYDPGKTYDGSPIANPDAEDLIITGANYNDVIFTWYKDSVAELNKLSAAPKDAGTYSLIAGTGETDNTKAAQTAPLTVTISKADLTVVGAAIAPKTYQPGNVSADVSDVMFIGLAASETLVSGTDYTAAGTFKNADAGTDKPADVTVTLLNTDRANNYNLTNSEIGAIGTIDKANQEAIHITGLPDGTITYNDTFTLSAGCDVHWYGDGAAVNADGNITIIRAGEVTVTAIKPGDHNYNDEEDQITFTAVQKELTVADAAAKNKFYDGSNTVKITDVALNGIVNNDDVSVDTTDLNGTVRSSDAGDYTAVTLSELTLTGSKAENYTIAPSIEVNTNVTIEKAVIALTAPGASNIQYGQKLSESILKNSSLEFGTFAWKDGNTVPWAGEGNYPVIFTANAETIKNYEISSIPETVTVKVEKAVPAVNITAKASGSKDSRQAVFAVTVTKAGSGAVPAGTVKFIDCTSGTEENIATKELKDGTVSFIQENLKDQIYIIRAVYEGDDNYKQADTEMHFDAARKSQRPLVITSIGNKTYGDPDFKLELEQGSGDGTGNVIWQSSDSSIVEISGSTAMIRKAGTVTITVTKEEDEIYNKAETSVLLTVGKKDITVQADHKEITAYDALPEFTVSCKGFADGENEITCMETKAAAACQTDGKTAGTFEIVLTPQAVLNTDASEKYVIAAQKNGILTVSEKIVRVIVQGGTGAAGSGSYAVGKTVVIDAGTKDGYQFDSWSGSVEFADKNEKITTFVMPKQDVIVTANWKKIESSSGGNDSSGSGDNSSGGNDSSGSGDNSSGGNDLSDGVDNSTDKADFDNKQESTTKPAEPTINIAAEPAYIITGTVTVPALQKERESFAAITKEHIEKAVEQAKSVGEKEGAVTVRIHITGGKGAECVNINLPKEVQEEIIKQNVNRFEFAVENPEIIFAFDFAAVEEIRQQANGDVVLTAKRVHSFTLSEQARAVVGERPVFDLKVTCINDLKSISDFGTGYVRAAIPYKLQEKEDAVGISAIYIDSTGEADFLTYSGYNREKSALVFAVHHFSVYGVGYRETVVCSDIKEHSAKDEILFALSHGLISSGKQNMFFPDRAVTFYELAAALGILFGAEPDETGGYIKWLEGWLDTKILPERQLTRQEAAVILSQFPAISSSVAKIRKDHCFADEEGIESYAKEAVKTMYFTGLMDGKNNHFEPNAYITRAELSRILYRYILFSIAPENMEQGWVSDASGSWNYYQNGKRVIGWKKVEGKWCYFDLDGTFISEPKTKGCRWRKRK